MLAMIALFIVSLVTPKVAYGITVSDWAITDLVGTTHWVVFLNASGATNTPRCCSWKASNDAGNQAHWDNSPNTGTWTRDGRTFNYAFIFDTTNANGNGLGEDTGYQERMRFAIYEANNSTCFLGNLDYVKKPVITWNANGGSCSTSSTTLGGANFKVGTLPTPTRSGYTFAGWYTAASGGTKIATTTKIRLSTTYYAQWTPKQTVFYINPNGGSVTAGDKNYLSGSAAGGFMSTIPYTFTTNTKMATYTQDSSNWSVMTGNSYTRAGYTFAGLYDAQTGGTQGYTSGARGNTSSAYWETNSAGNPVWKKGDLSSVNWYCRWTANSVTVTFNGNGGTIAKNGTQTFTSGKGQSFADTGVARPGYTMKGWANSASATTNDYSTLSGVSDAWIGTGGTRTLYAVWSPNSVTVTFNGNGGTIAKNGTQIFTSGKGQSFADTGVTRPGYTMLGWADSSTATAKQYNILSGVGDGWIGTGGTRTIYAVWQANTYTVTYNGNGSTGGSTASSSHTYGTAKNLTTNGFTRTGYSFVGWNTAANGSGTSYSNGQSVSNLTTASNGTVTLYAQWVLADFRGTAYAVLTSAGELVFFRSTQTYSAGANQTVSDIYGNTYTGHVYTGIESMTQHSSDPAVIATYAPWANERTQIRSAHTSGAAIIKPNISMDGWFYGCTSLTSVDLSNFDFSQVTRVRALFYGCSSIVNLNLGGWQMPSVIDVSWMFYRCTSMVSITLPRFGTGKIRTMDSVLAYCTRLTDIGWSSMDTSDVWTMWAALRGCASLQELDLSSFDTLTTRLTAPDRCEMKYLLDGCTGLRRITLGAKFSFKGTAGTTSSDDWTTLPANGFGWQNISVVTEDVAVSPEDLRDNYDGSITNTRYARGTYAIVYGIAYDANGGNGTMASTTHVNGRRSRISPCWFTRDGYAFAGWSTTADGTGQPFSDNQAIIDPPTASTLTLYAQWVPASVGHGGSFAASDREQAICVDKSGWYIIRAWGGDGGDANATYGQGGSGGYSWARVWLEANEVVYVSVGGAGSNCTGTYQRLDGGFNGGGTAANMLTTEWFGAGGGATHVALSRGLLRNFAASQDGILLVAGGGGGGAYESEIKSNAGGNGGGITGGDGGDWVEPEGSGSTAGPKLGGRGGTQTEGGVGGTGSSLQSSSIPSGVGYAGTFGAGGEGQTGFPVNPSNELKQEKWCGGGAGWYGGGSSGSWGASAGAGSGHVGAATHEVAGSELASRVFPTGQDMRMAYGGTLRLGEEGYVTKPVSGKGGYVTLSYVNDISGTADEDNPDGDGDDYGDNIAFSVTSVVTFVTKADGTLVAPTVASIENHNDFAIHASSVKVTATSPYTLSSSLSGFSSPDQIVLLFGSSLSGFPSLDASGYVTKAPLPATTDWNISPSSSLPLSFAGRVSGTSRDIVTQSDEFATMRWYVTAGENPST